MVNVSGTDGRGSNPVEINTILLGSIERVEILRNGASAQYNSDALAAVVNIVLEGGSEHGDIDLQAGQYSAGDGLSIIACSDNVTNQYPDRVIFANTTNGQLPYSEYSPFGFEGAFVYGKVAYHW